MFLVGGIVVVRSIVGCLRDRPASWEHFRGQEDKMNARDNGKKLVLNRKWQSKGEKCSV